MIVERKTRDINRYLTHLRVGETYFLGRPVDDACFTRLARLGLSSPLVEGERVLPPAARGAASRRNANGFDIVHRDRLMEVAYRQISWTYTQRHGDRKVEVTEIKDVSYHRYPRTKVAPYAIELASVVRSDGAPYVVCGPFSVLQQLDAVATNTANMLTEQLGGFEVLDASFSPSVRVPVRRLNWNLLPAGRNPWESARSALAEVVAKSRGRSREVVESRFQAVGAHAPEFIAVGVGGFDDYVAFGFPRLGLCVLESRYTNNATYILAERNWEAVSQMTKAQILNAAAHAARLIHTRSWFDELAAVFRGPSEAAA
jgi:hypothetical protein